ncbi:MAG: glycosyltransferase [archaeon]
MNKLKTEKIEEDYADNNFLITAMGRYTDQKGFDNLIKAVKNVIEKGYEIKLIIMGKGENKQQLNALIKKLNLKDKVELIGFKSNPYKYISESDLFVLSSNYEGFPNSLLEAMACEVPVISTDCPTGPSEIIDNNKNGILVPVGDVNKLTEEIIHIYNDSTFANKIASVAKNTIVSNYNIDKIMEEYSNLFLEMRN